MWPRRRRSTKPSWSQWSATWSGSRRTAARPRWRPGSACARTTRSAPVAAGTQSFAPAGKPPSGAEPIPAKLLLKVADAAAVQDRESLCAEVEGTAPASAEVLVDGAPAAVAEDGRFRVRVPAAADKKVVTV